MRIKKFRAFTMAEAILVMTILGIIAAVMLSTLKPTKWKDKSYHVLAKKVLYEIDTATSTILTTNSKYNTFDSMVNDSGGSVTFPKYWPPSYGVSSGPIKT